MKKKDVLLLAIFCFSLLLVSCNNESKTNKTETVSETVVETISPDTVSYNRQLTGIARFVAGMQPDENTALQSLTQTTAWQQYAQRCDSDWKRYNQEVSDSIRMWKQAEMAHICDTLKTVFYPFSGPDFLNANLYFPDAEKYILFGMEPPGTVPTPEKTDIAHLENYLQAYANAVSSLTNHSFFHTKKMAEQLETDEIYGITPILMLLMARCDKKIIDIRPFEFVENGKVNYLDEFRRYKGETKYGKGVEINFTDSRQKIKQKLIYFSANIADGGLSINTPTRDYLQTIDSNCIAYVKSATYLMHKSYFSTIRNTVLEKASVILQDDSGIKFSYFDPEKWQIQLYGVYEKPVKLFDEHFEQDLYDAYRQQSVKPLPFRRGYNSKSNQLLARKKD